MNKKTINLNGEWQLKGLSQNSQEKIEINALVPGQVHVDLLRERKIKDPFWRDQAELCQWVEDWNWEYSREFDVPEDYPLEWCELELKGLDTYAEISVNDVIIGNTYNMFIPHTFNVSKYLKTGKNNIKISFTPYWLKDFMSEGYNVPFIGIGLTAL